ncbi:MAG TPA: reverse transcriptase [Ruminococcaceae bacterium]|nr:reverse transcriptase [Oscillospiraceae bacterium]
MKRYGYLYEKIYARENISAAIDRAAHGKKKRHDVKWVLANKEGCIDEIQHLLITQTYVPSPYREKTVREGTQKKERHILVPMFFPDQIVQWAVLLQTIPILSKGMDAHVCGSVPGRGKDEARRYIQRWLRNDPKGTKYCLQLDIHRFYPSVNHDALKEMLLRVFKDEKLLQLLYLIIDSAPGLPIGNVTSQWLANFYLQGLDHYIKEQLRAKYYVRYMDDMILLGPNKRKLGRAKEAIEAYLQSIGLEINRKWQKYRVDACGIDFLGYRFFHDKTILRRPLMLRITRKVRRTAKRKSWNPHNCQSILSYMGWFKHTNNYGLYQKWVKPYIKVKRMKGVVRRESIQRNNAGKGVRNP